MTARTSRPRQSLDLTFDPHDSIISLPLRSARVVDTDGKVYDFRVPGVRRDLALRVAEAFTRMLSNNENSRQRRRSNERLARTLRNFLRFVAEAPVAEQTLSTETARAWKERLYAGNTATAYGQYGSFLRMMRHLRKLKRITYFPMPANESKAQAYAMSNSAGVTFADVFTGVPIDSPDAANERYLSLFLELCWSELETLFARLEIGRRWRVEAENGYELPIEIQRYFAWRRITRKEALDYIGCICADKFDARLPPAIWNTSNRASQLSKWERSLRLLVYRFTSDPRKRIHACDIKRAIRKARRGAPIPDFIENITPQVDLERERAVEMMVKMITARFGAYPLRTSLVRLCGDEWSDVFKWAHLQFHKKGRAIHKLEILSYFYPTAVLVLLSAAILCAAQINPLSVEELTVGALEADQTPQYRRLIWPKGRAGGEQDLPPFPVGGVDARLIPRLWEKLERATEELRTQVPDAIKDRLFIWANGMIETPISSFDRRGISISWRLLQRFLAGSTTELQAAHAGQAEFGPIRANIDKITPSLIRNTAINIANARLDRDFKLTAQSGGRMSIGPLDQSYLNNKQTKAVLDAQIRRGQDALVAWMREPLRVIADTDDAVMAAAAVSADAAKAARQDAYNLGYGVSLVNQNAIVIATPLNALRMMQWLRRMKGAEARVRAENPERWRLHYEPQIHVFAEALKDFPRTTLREAKEMDKTIEFPFPEVH